MTWTGRGSCLARCSLGALTILWPGSALAQANYDGALIGGRSSLMGGTGVAAGIDAAALTQNPATTIDIQGTSFVFSTFAMQVSERSIDTGENLDSDVTRGASLLSETQVNVLPNATCLFVDLHRPKKQRQGAHKLSVCITEPESNAFELESRTLASSSPGSGAFQTRFIRQSFSKQVYSAGWAFGLSERLSVGVTPMLQHVSFKDTEGLTTIVSDATGLDDVVGASGRNVTSIMTKDASAFAASALIGVQFRPTKGWITGISFETPSLHLTGGYDASRSSETTGSDAAEYMNETGSARFAYPPRIAFGLFGSLPYMTFELDGYFHAGSSGFARIESTREILSIADGTVTSLNRTAVSQRERVRPTMNVGFGVDVPFGKEWSVVSGMLTDFSGLEPRRSGASADDTLFRSRIDALHASVGVAWTPRVGSILLGFRGMYGEGELAVSDPRTLPPTRIAADQTLWGLALVISGQLSLGMLAIVDPTGLVKDPVVKPKPAAPQSEQSLHPPLK